ncbi:hypothetical protein CASFOL_015864 [Castilleja foliolosa]|uniref:DUF4408 domain-containing protein n=1 Tax=Castilleja foliolosa TaxID=1961234 RepID=A0ABD3DEY6_9LAMI
MDYSKVFDAVKFEKAKAIARFNMFRRISKSRQILEAVVLLLLIFWSTARVSAFAKTAAGSVLRFSTYLFNHHVVFLIGNAIIALIVVMCRRNDTASSAAGDLYDDYVKHSESPIQNEPSSAPTPDTAPAVYAAEEEEKKIVVCPEEKVVVPVRQSDGVAAAIEKAERQIKRFQRTQSEKLRREIGARTQMEFRRSESENRRNSVSERPQTEFRLSNSENRRKSVSERPQTEFRLSESENRRKSVSERPQTEFWQSESENRRKSVSSVEEVGKEDMERLSSEEFRRTVDAFIDKHWSKKTTKQKRFEEYEKYQLLQMA